MALDTLEIFGTEFTNVTGIKATDDQSGTKVYIRPQGTKSITQNGTGIDVAEYASVNVSVSGGQPNLQTKTKTYTPTESAQTETVSADSGYDGLDTVDISVGAISSTYVGTGITRRSSSDLQAWDDVVVVPSGYYAQQEEKSVGYVSLATPTATKGAVSNHSVSVTPSITQSYGYTDGGTKTGTAVTVSASELVSGSETKTANGTYDVTNLAQLIVNVAGGGTSGLEFETGTWEPSSDIAKGEITWSRTHTEAPVLVLLADMTGTADTTTQSNYIFAWCDYYKLWGSGVPQSSSAFRYANVYFTFRGASTTSTSTATYACSQNSDSTTSSGTGYPRYWVSPTAFHPYTNSSSRYWRAGRTYKWIAIWKPTT